MKKPENMIAEYDDTIVGASYRHFNDSLEPPGDPAKGSKRIVDLLRGDWPGIEKGKKLPVRLALGDDVYEYVKENYEFRLKENAEWRDWICGVSYE
jgi:hypothetical protein